MRTMPGLRGQSPLLLYRPPLHHYTFSHMGAQLPFKHFVVSHWLLSQTAPKKGEPAKFPGDDPEENFERGRIPLTS